MSAPSSQDFGSKDVSTSYLVRRLMRDYISREWGLLSLAVFCMLFTSLMGGLIPMLVNWNTKYIFLRHDASMLLPLSLAAFGVMALRAASGFVGKATIDSLGEKAVARAQGDMFGRLIRRDLADLNSVHSGQFVSSFLYDATLMRDALTQGVAAVALELVQLIIYIAYVLVSDWQLGLATMLALPGVAWAMERLGGSMRRAATRGMQETGDLSVVLSEALDGRRVIKAYNLEEHSMARVQDRLSKRLKTLIRAVRLRDAAVPMTDIFAGLVIAGVFFYAGWQNLHGELTLNTFAAFIVALLLALQPVRNLSQLWPTAAAGMGAASRMFAAIDARPRIITRPSASLLKVLPGGGAVRFRNVGFAYQTSNEPALENVDLDIPAGKKIALVGPSGGGKSTLFNLLLRFYDPDGGSIAIDGQDIHGVTIESLRAAIGLVTQETILFDESVADNIALGRPGATTKDIEQAARDAAAHDFIRELPQGYDTRIGEGGLKLSGGQRQRIAIARAMLRAAPILLLDEATSALDTTSERQVQEALTRLMNGRTTIVIAHRLSTVLDADHIYVLDRGRVVEQGNHDALLARGGLYAQLYRHNLTEPEPV